jgi:negative regulator of flagellin synthesis FlgM
MKSARSQSMDIRSSLEGLRMLLGVNPAASPIASSASQSKVGAPAAQSSLESDRATLSSAASEVSLTASGDDARAGKVAEVQAALAAGTYNVPASAVASKVIDSMLLDAMSESQSQL